MPLTLESNLIDEVAVIRCKGRLTHGAETEALEMEVERQTKAPGTNIYTVKHVVLNLAETEFIDSAGLGTLIRLLSTFRAARGGLKLCQVSAKVTSAIEITHLGSLFPAYGSEAEAIGAFDEVGAGPGAISISSKTRIVCLDPSRDLLAGLYALLSQAGYEVFTTRFAGDAAALAKTNMPSILICGPGMITVPAAPGVIERLQRDGAGLEIWQLPADFQTAEAGKAGQQLLSRLQKAIAARASG
jgi:anti-sigma B factor antagonist